MIDYHPALPDITGILRKYQHLLHCSETMRNVVTELPVVTFRRPPYLGNFLVRAKLHVKHKPVPDIGPCNKSRCQICPLVDPSPTVRSCVSNKLFRSKCQSANCDSKNIVYVLTCKQCNRQYVGSTVTKFRIRFNNHKSRIRNFVKTADDDSFRLYEHFNAHSSTLDSCLSVQFLEQSNNEESLRTAETQWIWKLKSVFPRGLNVNDGFCSQLRHKRN